MNWSIFWEAAGAIATTAAVIVALWQTKFANMKKAKLSFVEDITIVPIVAIGSIGYMPKTKYVGVDFTNVGNRKIILQSFWVELTNGVRAIIKTDDTPIGTLSWPIVLDIEENVFIPWEKEKFISFLKNETDLLQHQRLTFCVTDSTGVVYKCKTPKTVQQYIRELEESYKKDDSSNIE